MGPAEIQSLLTEIPLVGPLFAGSLIAVLLRVLGLVVALGVGIKLLNWAWGRGGPRAESVRSLIKHGRYEEAGDVLSRKGDLEGALEHYTTAEAWLKAGHMARRLGRTRDSANFFEKAKDYKLAIAAFEAAGQEEQVARLALRSQDPSLLAKAAVWHEKIEDFLKAGKLFAKAGRLRDAERCFLKGGKEGRDYAIKMLVSAYHERGAGRGKRARELAAKAAHLLGQAGQRKQAVQLCHQAGVDPRKIESLAEGQPSSGGESKSSTRGSDPELTPRPQGQGAGKASRDDNRIQVEFDSIDDFIEPVGRETPQSGSASPRARASQDELRAPVSASPAEPQSGRAAAQPRRAVESRGNEAKPAAEPLQLRGVPEPADDVIDDRPVDDTIPDDDLPETQALGSAKKETQPRPGEAPLDPMGLAKIASVSERLGSSIQIAQQQQEAKKRARPKTQDVAAALLMVLEDDEESEAAAEALKQLPPELTDEVSDEALTIDVADSPSRSGSHPGASPQPESRSDSHPGASPQPARGPFGLSSDVTSRYEVLARIGQGGMGEVFKAQDTSLGREVALKFLSNTMVGDETAMRFFMREARAAAALNHPAIVTVYDIGVLDGRPFICMEYVDGTDLATRIDDQGPVSLGHAVNLTVQLALALDYAHERNVVHRDIKPPNVIQARGGVVKILDFGLAKAISGGPRKSTVVSGTPDYMSPEQLAGRPVDGRTDIFSLGVLLYEILTGSAPFEGALRSSNFEPVSARAPWLPAALDSILVKALALDPDDRYQRGRDLAQALQDLPKS